ncbi:MAG: carboxypeptidase-like regulatory domain-containing protein [Anaerolineales bacterium]
MTKYLQTGTAAVVLFMLLLGCSTPQPTITDTPSVTSSRSEPTATPSKTTPTEDISSDQKTPPPITATPTVCTGWRKGVSGIVYDQEAVPGHELAGVEVTLTQISSCSTTAGEYQTLTDADGSFRFEDLYIHDMDAIDILIEHEGYQTYKLKISRLEIFEQGSAIDIILEPISQ